MLLRLCTQQINLYLEGSKAYKISKLERGKLVKLSPFYYGILL